MLESGNQCGQKLKRGKTKRRMAILNNRLITGYNLLGDIITLSSAF